MTHETRYALLLGTEYEGWALLGVYSTEKLAAEAAGTLTLDSSEWVECFRVTIDADPKEHFMRDSGMQEIELA